MEAMCSSLSRLCSSIRYNFGMTYCVGLLVDTGLAMLSD
jgi:hypothetical protein